METFAIRTDTDHQAALREIESLWGAKEATEDFNRLDILGTLVDAYDAKRWPVAELDPVNMPLPL
jgi:HTH-type transcriptional regulator/antitoxin HigA